MSRAMSGGNCISNAARTNPIRMNKAELKALRGAFRTMALCTADAYAVSFLVRGKTDVFP